MNRYEKMVATRRKRGNINKTNTSKGALKGVETRRKNGTLKLSESTKEKLKILSTKHGLHGTPTYISYRCMLGREGRKGAYEHIRVCDRWKESILNFVEDIGMRPSKDYVLDRIDPNGNYEPGNVRWVTWSISNKNKRK